MKPDIIFESDFAQTPDQLSDRYLDILSLAVFIKPQTENQMLRED